MGGGQAPKQVSLSELAADSSQQASAVTPKEAAVKTGREMMWKCGFFLKIFIF